MKFEIDKKYFKICLYAFLTVAALLLFNRLLQSSDDIWQSVKNGVSFLLALLSPFITAILIAYILSPAVTAVERLLGRIFRGEKHGRARKMAALVIVYVLLLALLALALSYVIPGIVRNIGDLIRNLPDYFNQWTSFYNRILVDYPLLANDVLQHALTGQLDKFKANLSGYMVNSISGITSFVVSLTSSIAGGILGLVLSFYLLNEREHIGESFHRLLRARLGDRRSNSAMGFLNAVDKVFGRYISAKLLISVVIFCLSMVIFSLLGVRYSVLMSAVVALTNLVPYIGPVVGAIPPIAISLLDSPQKALWVTISILLIHAVDGYFIEPYVISDRLGLSPFWILLSIIVGGGLFGLWGILLAVPTAAVIKLLIDRYIRGRMLKRQSDRNEKERGAGKTPER